MVVQRTFAALAPSIETRALGRSGSCSHTAVATSIGELVLSSYGGWPHSSSYNTTPSEYVSLAVVSALPHTCSGLAYSGVNARPPGLVTGALARLSAEFISFAMPK